MYVFAGIAPFAGVGKVVADADWRGAFRNVALTLNVMASGFEMLTFFGRGNETVPALRANDQYYRVHQTQLRVEPAMRWPATGSLSVTVRTSMRYAYAEHRANKYVTDVRPYGIGAMTFATLGAGVRWDTRDDDVQPHTGLYADLSGTFVPKAFGIGEAFGRMKGDLRVFVTTGNEDAATFSLRFLGDRTWGKVPFFEAATIGSGNALRGYQLGRFAGASSAVGIAEARLRLGRIDLVTPVPFGVFGFAETGRVFEPGEDSRLWHPSVGGGVWAAPWKRDATLTASIGISKESVMLYGAVGFGF
jgi:outer membrane protein assembly factor BamA